VTRIIQDSLSRANARTLQAQEAYVTVKSIEPIFALLEWGWSLDRRTSEGERLGVLACVLAWGVPLLLFWSGLIGLIYLLIDNLI
jgi:hypothetical protein